MEKMKFDLDCEVCYVGSWEGIIYCNGRYILEETKND